MPVKRTRAKTRTRTLPRQLQAAAGRALELSEAHLAAIDGGDQSFYDDGRHDELVGLLPILHQALDIKPWQDFAAIVREALAALDERGGQHE